MPSRSRRRDDGDMIIEPNREGVLPPRVAVVGRPNVGKSTLFNRLVRRKLALVDKTPGLTRDRREAQADLGPWTITLVDTAGLEEGDSGSITARMRAQSEVAIHEADLVMFVIDGRAGVVPGDEVFAALVRDTGRPALLVVNKCEGRDGLDGAYDAFRLGMGDPVAISAEHGDGMGELARELTEKLDGLLADGALVEVATGDDGDAISLPDGDGVSSAPDGDADALPEPPDAPDVAADDGKWRDRPLKVAIVGRPNAGKSTLVNALIGDERMITGPEAGITRDTIAVDHRWLDRSIKLFDTAGLRRKSRIHEKPEQLSVGDALRAVRFAEVVVLLMDADNALEKQDLAIADLVAREGRGLVLAVNKWDTVEDRQSRLHHLRLEVERLLPQVRGVPIVTLSAIRATGLDRLQRAVREVEETWNRRIATATLNRFLAEATAIHTPPAVHGKRVRLRFMTQSNARPPTFIVFTTRPDAVPESYLRYLINGLRDGFDLWGVPVRIHLRKGKNPYA